MNIPLINGNFSAADTMDLLTQMIHVKIKFHEGKIAGDSHEEDIKMRERRIKELQKDLYEIRKYVSGHHGPVNLHAEILITE
jgi:hypothetical protein